jgi:hypothetical protein
LEVPPMRVGIEHHVPLVDIERSVFHVVKIGLNPARSAISAPTLPSEEVTCNWWRVKTWEKESRDESRGLAEDVESSDW